MKFRQEKPTNNDQDERALLVGIKALDGPGAGERRPASGDPYWQNLLVRTNERLDRATSGKALSISWAARVAIPGVIAIVSFLIALHYYVPEPSPERQQVSALLQSLPDQSLDSLMADTTMLSAALRADNVSASVFTVTPDQVEDYFIETDEPTAVLATMSEAQLTAVEHELNTRLR